LELTEPLLQDIPNETLNPINTRSSCLSNQTTNDSNIQKLKRSSAKRKSNEISSSSAPTGNSSDDQPTTSVVNQQKKQRGRPTIKPQTESISATNTNANPRQKKKRGRPKKEDP
jgi:hypothetical protein